MVAALAVLVLAAAIASFYFIDSGSQEAAVTSVQEEDSGSQEAAATSVQEEPTEESAAPEVLRATVGVVDNPSYLSIRTDGTPVYARYTQPGFTQTYEAREIIGVTAGNAAAVRVEVNGQDRGALGNAGETVTYTIPR